MNFVNFSFDLDVFDFCSGPFFFFLIFIVHFQKLHTELERCEPRVVSLLEAADWLRQANEKTGVTRPDQTVVDSHTRLSHLRARLTVLINMTASYTSKLGSVLGYDMSPEAVCTRLHQVHNTKTKKFYSIFVIVLIIDLSIAANHEQLQSSIRHRCHRRRFKTNGQVFFKFSNEINLNIPKNRIDENICFSFY